MDSEGPIQPSGGEITEGDWLPVALRAQDESPEGTDCAWHVILRWPGGRAGLQAAGGGNANASARPSLEPAARVRPPASAVSVRSLDEPVRRARRMEAHDGKVGVGGQGGAGRSVRTPGPPAPARRQQRVRDRLPRPHRFVALPRAVDDLDEATAVAQGHWKRLRSRSHR